MSERVAGRKGKILVADDDLSIRLLVKAVLKRARYEVDTAANGREVLEKVGAAHYDVVVLDLMMPDVSGFEVLERIAPREPFFGKFVVIMSATSPEAIAKAASEKVFTAVRKPFEIADLVSMVDACIAACEGRLTVASDGALAGHRASSYAIPKTASCPPFAE